MEKTNVMRLLDRQKIKYNAFEYDQSVTEGTLIAEMLGENPKHVFKTLVTVANNGAHFVFCVPVAETLDLKKAAKAVGVKAISMLKQKELLPLTGYIHGGCSPIGMKKPFKTVIHHTAERFDTIFVSAGRVGKQVELSPTELCTYINASFTDVIVD